MTRLIRNHLPRYSIAIVANLIALGLSLFLAPWLGSNVFPIFLAAVIISAHEGGIAAGLVATALASLLTIYFFLPPQFSLEINSIDTLVKLIVFVSSAVLVTSLLRARSRAERTTGELREWFEATLAGIGDAVIATDTQGTVAFMNATAESLTGWTQSDARGKDLDVVFHIINPDTRAPVESPVTRVRREGAASRMSNRTLLVSRDGHEIPIVDSAAPVLNQENQITVIVIIFRDVAERTHAEAVLQNQAALLDLSPDAIFSRDVNDAITYWSRGAEELYGFTRQEALGRISHDLLQTRFPQSKERVHAALEEKGRWEGELRHTTRTGARVVVVSRQIVQHDAQGQLVQILETNSDITERQRAEERLAARERQQAAVAKLGQDALAGTELDALMTEAARVLTDTLDVEYSKVLEILPGGETLLLRAGVGWHVGAVGTATESTGINSPAGYTLLSSEPVIVKDLVAETRFTGGALLEGHRVVSGMSVIIHGAEKPFGVLGAYTTRRRTFTQDDINFLQAVSNVLGAAIERTRTEGRLQASRDQLEVILSGVTDGITVQDPHGALVYVNDTAAQLSGFESAEQMLKTPLEKMMGRFEVFDEFGNPLGLNQLPGRLALQGVPTPEMILEYRVHATGQIRWSVVKATPVLDEAGRVRLAINFFKDITELKRKEQALAFLAEASVRLTKSLDYAATLASVTELLVPYLADWCAIDVLNDDGSLRRVAVEHVDPARRELILELNRKFPLNVDAPYGYPKVIRSGRSTMIPNATEQSVDLIAKGPEHRALIDELGFVSHLCVPLETRGRTFGAITLNMGPSGRRYGPAEQVLAEDLGRRAATAIDNARLYQAEQQALEESERGKQRLAFLADASTALASSLDYETTLAKVAQLAVPDIADWCAVDVVNEEGTTQRVALAHVDPTKVEMAREYQRRYPTDPNAPAGVPNVLRTGKPEILAELTDEMLDAAGLDEDQLRMVHEVGIHSYMILPLAGRGRILGAITFVSSDARRRYGEDDLKFAGDLARRAAVAIENARLYQEAQTALRVRDQFLSIASHEVKTPLTVIQGYTQLLIRHIDRTANAARDLSETAPSTVSFDRGRLVRNLRNIEHATARLTGLVNDLFDVTRIQTKSLSINPEHVNLNDLLTTVMDSVRMQYQDSQIRSTTGSAHPRNVQVLMETPTSAQVWGKWDRNRIEQVFVNLIDNAIKYSPPNGIVRVELTVEPRDGLQPPQMQAHLVVHDQGIGIPSGEQERIFEPFTRATNAARRNFPGLGLGLAISREIIERHGGKIWVESGGRDQGSTFHVVLPGVE